MNASSFGLRQMIDQEPGKGGVPTAAGLEDHIGIWHGTNIKQVAGKRFVAWCFRQGTEIGDAGPEVSSDGRKCTTCFRQKCTSGFRQKHTT